MLLSLIPSIRSIVLALIFAALTTAPVFAAAITVSGDCSLAEAITNVNDDAATHSDCTAGSGADTITLSADITLTAALPAIASDITIEGGGYTISGDDKYRIFSQTSGAAVLNNLTLTKGKIANGDGGAIHLTGGSVTLDGLSISDSEAKRHGGGIYSASSVLTIKNSAIFNNTAGQRGGGINVSPNGSGNILIQNSTFYGNSGAGGGAIIATNSGNRIITLNHVTVTDNSDTATETNDKDGGVYNLAGSMRITNSILARNGNGDCFGYSMVLNAGNVIETNYCGGSPLTSDPKLPEDPTIPEDGSPPYYAIPQNSPARNVAATVYCKAAGNVD